MTSDTLGNIASLGYFGPELALMGAALLVIIWDLIVKERRTRVFGAAALCLAALAYSALASASFLTGDVPAVNLFGGMPATGDIPRIGLLAFDDFTHMFRILFAFVSGVIILFAAPPMLDESTAAGERREPAEMMALLMVLTVGMNMMAASRHLLMIYLSLEMVSVMSFVLAGYKVRNRKSSEGALKYVIYGGVASGVMLYGMSWIYGVTGSLNLGEIHAALSVMTGETGRVPPAALIGVICMLAGFGYKVSAAPFHMWTPDVYEGAPTPITALLSVGPKAAGLAVLIRFFDDALGAGGSAEAMKLGASVPWPIIAGVLAMATMSVGNLTALNQDNVKRMLAFSSIAHAGYMLLGFAVFTETGLQAIVFYAVAYAFMNLGAFLVVMAVAEVNGGDESVGAFLALGRRAPVLAAVMTIFLVSLAGIPPFVGFIGKFYIFAALIGVGGSWCWLLAVVGVVNSIISLFYYARIIRAMYLQDCEVVEPLDVRKTFGAVSVALAVPVIVLGVYWGPVYDRVANSVGMIHEQPQQVKAKGPAAGGQAQLAPTPR